MNDKIRALWKNIENAWVKDSDIIASLTKLDKDEINTCSYSGKNMLMLALEEQRAGLVVPMIQLGINPRKVTQTGATALHVACQHEPSADVIQTLVDNGVNVNAVDAEGHTALFYLIKSILRVTNDAQEYANLMKCIAIIMRSGCIHTISDDTRTRTILTEAARNRYDAEIIRCLVDNMNTTEINVQDENGYSALMYAAEDDNDTVQHLLAKGADPNQKNANGETTLNIALKKKNFVAAYRLARVTNLNDCDLSYYFAMATVQETLDSKTTQNTTSMQKKLIESGLHLSNIKIHDKNLWEHHIASLSTYGSDYKNQSPVIVWLFGITYHWLKTISKNQQLKIESLNPLIDYMLDRADEKESILGYSKITKMLAAFKLFIYQVFGDTYHTESLWLNKEEKVALQQGRLGKLFASTGLSINALGKLSGSKGILFSQRYFIDSHGHFSFVQGIIPCTSVSQSAVGAASSSGSPSTASSTSSSSSSSSSDFSSTSSSSSHDARHSLRFRLHSSRLFEAINDNDVDTFSAYLGVRTDINLQNAQGETLLHYAIIKGNKAIVALLLEKGFNLLTKNVYGYTALHRAVISNNKDIVAMLLKADANQLFPDKNDEIPLHWAAEAGYSDIVELLLQDAKAGKAKNIQNKDGHTPLYRAIISQDVATVRCLLNADADPNIPSHARQTPLCLAIEKGDSDIVALLLKAHADPNMPNRQGRTPLGLAVDKGDSKLVALLLNAGSNPNMKGYGDQLPLYVAATKGDSDIVALLLEAGSDPDIHDNCGRTPLYLAVIRENIKMAELLLKAGANPNIHDNAVQTPLYLAVGKHKIVALLLEHGANSDIAPPSGDTPLELACVFEDPTMIEQLLKQAYLDLPQSRSSNFNPGFFPQAKCSSNITANPSPPSSNSGLVFS